MNVLFLHVMVRPCFSEYYPDLFVLIRDKKMVSTSPLIIMLKDDKQKIPRSIRRLFGKVCTFMLVYHVHNL